LQMTAGTIKARTFQFLYRVMPPFLWDAVNTWTGQRNASRGQTYQGVTTDYDAAPLHVGHYGEALRNRLSIARSVVRRGSLWPCSMR
jgi:hypothetical protein